MDSYLLKIAQNKTLADYHHLAGYLYARGLTQEQSFRQSYMQQFARNEEYLRLLNELDPILSSAKISPTLIKGAALLETVYKNIGERFLSDIDLYIEKKDLAPFTEIALSLGFKEFPSDHWHTKAHVTHFVRGNLALDLHIGKIFSTDTRAVSWRTQKSSRWNTFRELAPEDQIIQILGHWGFQNAGRYLYSLIDVSEILKANPNISLNNLKNRAKEKHQAKAVNTGLRALGLQHQGIKLKEAYLINPANFPIEYLFIKNRMYDSLWEALKDDAKWIKHSLAKKSISI